MKKVLYGFIALILVVGLTGCGKKEEPKKNESDGTFTYECTDTASDTDIGMETSTVTTYHFNKDQYADSLTVVSTSKFKDKKTYDQYKDLQKEAIEDDQEEGTTYDFKTDDEKLTSVVTMKAVPVKEEDKTAEDAKASKIIKEAEENGAKCVLKGIDKKDIKGLE